MVNSKSGFILFIIFLNSFSVILSLLSPFSTSFSLSPSSISKVPSSVYLVPNGSLVTTPLPSSTYIPLSFSSIFDCFRVLENLLYHACITILDTAMVSRAPIGPPNAWRYISPPKVYTKLVKKKFIAISKHVAIKILFSLSVGVISGHDQQLSTQFPLISLSLASTEVIPDSFPLLPFLFQGSRCAILLISLVLSLFRCIYSNIHSVSMLAHSISVSSTISLTILLVLLALNEGNKALTSEPKRT